MHVLTINAGSSSIKYAVFAAGDPPKRVHSGTVERLGRPGSPTPQTALAGILKQVADSVGFDAIQAVGHRVVHGGSRYLDHQPITPEMSADLRRLSSFDPEHLPAEIALIDAVAAAHPNLAHDLRPLTSFCCIALALPRPVR